MGIQYSNDIPYGNDVESMTLDFSLLEEQRRLEEESLSRPIEANEWKQEYTEDLQYFFNEDRSVFNRSLTSSSPTYKDFQ